MASCFITLKNGETWSYRWTAYDIVLKEIAKNTTSTELKNWIKLLLPGENDYECGYCFIRESDGENVVREIDLRYLKDKYQIEFADSVERIIQNLKGQESDFLFINLFDMLQKSEQDIPVEPDQINNEEFEKYKLLGKKR